MAVGGHGAGDVVHDAAPSGSYIEHAYRRIGIRRNIPIKEQHPSSGSRRSVPIRYASHTRAEARHNNNNRDLHRSLGGYRIEITIHPLADLA